jgi:xanthine dehydrogenase/oxidase
MTLFYFGTTQGIAIIEFLIEHLAKTRQEDPLEFRLKNLNTSGNEEANSMRKIIDEVRRSSEFDKRLGEVKKAISVDIYLVRVIFHDENVYGNRSKNSTQTIDGKSAELIFFLWNPVESFPFRCNVLVAIYHEGGSVAVSHGGIECGQGINT